MVNGVIAGLVLGMMGQGEVKVVEPMREFRAVWVATVANIDYPSKPGLPVAQLKSEMIAILDKCQELNLNAVIFQVRPSADALYKSDLEPWSWYLTGEQGKAPADGFDPLAFAIEESHKRGLELHAWCNPYRALHPNQKGGLARNHLATTNSKVVKQYGTYLWMDPGEKAVQDRSYDVFMDLVSRYDLDGIHIDDYFFPYPITEGGKKVDFPDNESYGAYWASGGRLGRNDWRRKSVDDFIHRVYTGMKKIRPTVKFGISPFGIYRPGVPAGIRAGIDQYDELYADCLRWYREGWLDYYTPQLYWPIDQTPQAYPVLLKYWAEQNAKGRHFWPGNYTSRTNPKDGNWNPSEVVNQIKLTRSQKGSDGNVHFSMKALMQNFNGISDTLKKDVYSKPALIPASPWLDSEAPGIPEVESAVNADGEMNLKVSTGKTSDFRFVLVQTSSGKQVLTSNKEINISTKGEKWAMVRLVDRAGNVGQGRLISTMSSGIGGE